MSQENVIIDPAVRRLWETATLGEQTKLFLNSDIGEYLLNRAREECDEALVALAGANPEDAGEIRKHQHTIKVCEAVVGWMADAIQSGENAMKELHEEG